MTAPNASHGEIHSPDLVRLREISERLVPPELYIKISEILPVPLVVVNSEGRIVIFNPAAELLFGYARTEVIGEKVEILLPEAFREIHASVHRPVYMADMRVRPMGSQLNLAGRHKEGFQFPAEVDLGPVVITDGRFVLAVIRKVKPPAQDRRTAQDGGG